MRRATEVPGTDRVDPSVPGHDCAYLSFARPASAQASSLSPPGAPETLSAPTTSPATTICLPPAKVMRLSSPLTPGGMAPGVGGAAGVFGAGTDLPNSPELMPILITV